MKVTSEKIENCQVALNIEVEANELDRFLNEAYHRLVNKVSIPGFRKGKAPRVILEQHLGKSALLEDALGRMIPQLYKQAIESEQIDAIAEPQIEISQTEPVIFKAIVPVKPEIRLGDYHNIELKPESVEIGDEEIQTAMEQIRQGHAVLVPVDRSVQLGDVVTIDIEANIEGKPFLDHKDMVYEVDQDLALPLPGFAQNLEGAEKNKERTFSLDVPADYSIRELAGKKSFFKVTVAEVKEKELPQLDDELATSIGYDSLTAMEEKVTADLRTKAEEKSRRELRQKALDAVEELSEVEYPPVLEDSEVGRLLEDEARHFGFSDVQDYLKRTNKTREKCVQELSPVAKRRIIHSLVLEKIAEEEKIEITASEVDNKIEEIVNSNKGGGEREREGESASNDEAQEKMRQFLALPQVRESIEQNLRTQKTVDRLVQIATGSRGEGGDKGVGLISNETKEV
jgi:trigger factor